MLTRFLCGLIVACATCTVTAQGTYPDKPIRVISPFTPGGGTDYVARLLATKFGEVSKWQAVVENRPGANGTLGLIDAAHARPDGYDLVVGQKDNLIISPLLMTVAFDPVKDFTPIGMVGTTPIVILAAANSRYKTFADVAAAAKAAPGKLTFGTSGTGSVSHITSELLRQQAGIDLLHVPYKGSTPALTDLMGGHVELVGSSIASAMPFLQGGQMRALAVSTARRSPTLPDVPTIAELGYPNFDVTAWWGLLGPAGMPANVVSRLNTELNRILARDEVRAALREQGVAAEPGTPKAFGDFVKQDYANWKGIIASTGVRIN